MSASLLDTSILIRYLRKAPGYLDMLQRLGLEGSLVISAITRLEVVRGMREHERQETFALFGSLETAPVNAEIADLAGELILSWHERGVILGDMDAIIAASALIGGLPLVTTNPKHFPMPDLTVLQVDENGQMTLRE
jgi:tRNA(fMet)-specific endonuclease VapC